jgi:hypothetical protein
MNIITIDLGGTNVRIARATGIDRPEFTAAPIRRQTTHVYEDDLAFIIATATALSDNEPIDAVGIGVPGRVNDGKTDMVASNNLPEWTNRNFTNDIAKALKCPVYMDNDAVAASLGETYYGNTKESFHYLIWGTGISGVDVESSGDTITATYIRPHYQQLFDSWEGSCSGTAIKRKYGKSGEGLNSDEWLEVNAIFADHLHQYVTQAKPPAVVFGGGLAVHHAETITSHAIDMGITITVTQFGNDCGLIGGLGLVRRGVLSAK